VNTEKARGHRPRAFPFFKRSTPYGLTLRVEIRRLFRRERAGELDQHRAEMRAVAEEVRRAAAAGQQKSNRREISLGRVAGLAREEEIVAPIVGGLAAPRGNVVECHGRGSEALATVGADRTVPLEEPSPCLGVGDASRGMRGKLEWPVGSAPLRALLSSSPATALRSEMVRFGRGGFVKCQGTSVMMMVRRTALNRALLWPFVAIGRILKMSGQTGYD
jgi:hypothetical protein